MLTIRRNKQIYDLHDFRYLKLLNPLSQSINNPFKVFTPRVQSQNKIREKAVFTPQHKTENHPITGYKNFSEWAKPFKITTMNEINKSSKDREYIVTTKDVESCFAIEKYIKEPEIELMSEQIVMFLNGSAFPNRRIKGMVLDFIQGKNNS